MRRNLSLLGLALGLGLALWPQPLGRAITAGSAGTKFGPADAALAQSERPLSPRVTGLFQGLRSRLSRLTTTPSNALPAGALAFSELASVHVSRQPAGVALVHIAAGARTLFPRAPPLSA